MKNWLRIIFDDVVSFWIMATVSLCLGLLLNQFRDKPLSLIYQTKAERLQMAVSRIESNRQAPAELSGNLSLDDMRSFVEERRGVILDARPEVFHRLGHIPGALSLPRDDFENAYNKLKSRLERNKNASLIVYCSGSSCEDSMLVQEALAKLGYAHVAIFHGGWGEWNGAGFPEEKTQ